MDVFYELQPAVHAGSLSGADMFGADRGCGAVRGAPPADMGISPAQVYRPASAADLVLVRGNPDRRIADLDSIVAVWRLGKPAPHVIANFTP